MLDTLLCLDEIIDPNEPLFKLVAEEIIVKLLVFNVIAYALPCKNVVEPLNITPLMSL
jgi:hypothetical protein